MSEVSIPGVGTGQRRVVAVSQADPSLAPQDSISIEGSRASTSLSTYQRARELEEDNRRLANLLRRVTQTGMRSTPEPFVPAAPPKRLSLQRRDPHFHFIPEGSKGMHVHKSASSSPHPDAQ